MEQTKFKTVTLMQYCKRYVVFINKNYYSNQTCVCFNLLLMSYLFVDVLYISIIIVKGIMPDKIWIISCLLCFLFGLHCCVLVVYLVVYYMWFVSFCIDVAGTLFCIDYTHVHTKGISKLPHFRVHDKEPRVYILYD